MKGPPFKRSRHEYLFLDTSKIIAPASFPILSRLSQFNNGFFALFPNRNLCGSITNKFPFHFIYWTDAEWSHFRAQSRDGTFFASLLF